MATLAALCAQEMIIAIAKNYVVTIELILAGDENLTPNQNIEIFSAVYSYCPIFIVKGTFKEKVYTVFKTMTTDACRTRL
jgi:hypothetical protein